MSRPHEHTLAEWEAYGERFVQLYMVEDRTLTGVHDAMTL